MNVLGIDIGGSGIKGAIVQTQTAELVSERIKIPTPANSTPSNVALVVQDLVNTLNYTGPVGCSFPTVIKNGRAMTSGNLDKKWIGVQVDQLFEKSTGLNFSVHNDADLAGIAEMKLGAGKDEDGLVIMITIGTGLGSGLFYNGQLIPNMELGRIFGKKGKPIEFYTGDKARKDANLSWKKWGKRFNFFLNHIDRVCTPDLFILGGGASKKYDLFKDQIQSQVPIKIATFKNNAGIIGAALSARHDV